MPAASGRVGGVERVVGQFLEHESPQHVAIDAGLHLQAVERGEQVGVRPDNSKNWRFGRPGFLACSEARRQARFFERRRSWRDLRKH